MSILRPSLDPKLVEDLAQHYSPSGVDSLLRALEAPPRALAFRLARPPSSRAGPPAVGQGPLLEYRRILKDEICKELQALLNLPAPLQPRSMRMEEDVSQSAAISNGTKMDPCTASLPCCCSPLPLPRELKPYCVRILQRRMQQEGEASVLTVPGSPGLTVGHGVSTRSLPVVALYVTAAVGVSILRGADLYCPGVVAVRDAKERLPLTAAADAFADGQKTGTLSAGAVDEPALQHRGLSSSSLLGHRCEIRILPSSIHITRGQDADAAWDDVGLHGYAAGTDRHGVDLCDHNKVAEGILQIHSRPALFSATSGVAVAIDTLFYYQGPGVQAGPSGSESGTVPSEGHKATCAPLPAAHGVLEGKLWHQHTASTMGALALMCGNTESCEQGGNLGSAGEQIVNQQAVNILDMCAAPGGKTLALADFAPDYVTPDRKVHIVALDRSFAKLRRVERGLEEMGYSTRSQRLRSDRGSPVGACQVTVDVFKADSSRIVKGAPDVKAAGRGGQGGQGEEIDGSNEHESVQISQENEKERSITVTEQMRPPGGGYSYHKVVIPTAEQWDAFYQVILGKDGLAEEGRYKKDRGVGHRSQKRLFKAVLRLLGRQNCSREVVECMVRRHNLPCVEATVGAAEYAVQERARQNVEASLGLMKEADVERGDTLQSVIGTDAPRCSADTTGPRVLGNETAVSSPLSRGPPFAGGSFDLILVDVPCSGMGQRPLLSFPLSFSDICSTAAYQRPFLRQAFLLAKDGASIVYSTCTLSFQENEENVVWFLEEFAGRVELVDLRDAFSEDLDPNQELQDLGTPRSKSQPRLPYDHPELYGLPVEGAPRGYDRRFVFRFDPRNWDLGFFVAKFRAAKESVT